MLLNMLSGERLSPNRVAAFSLFLSMSLRHCYHIETSVRLDRPF